MAASHDDSLGNDVPVDEYLAYLRDAITVEREGRAWRLIYPLASLQSLLAEKPPATTIFAAERDGIWELSDLGQNLRLLRDFGVDAAKLLDDGIIQGMLSNMAVEVSDNGALTVRTSPQLGFGEALHHMVRANSAFVVQFSHILSSESGELSDMFDLEGEKHTFSGTGSGDDSPEQTEEFDLAQGALIVYSEHSGAGGFTMDLERVDGGFFGSFHELVSDDGEGGWIVARKVNDGWFEELKPGKHRLNVNATGRWTCNLVQPYLGQSPVTIPYRSGGSEGGLATGPFRVGSRPLLASIRHDGGGPFLVRLISLDGTDQTDVVEETGQIHLEEHPTEAMPGKEYLLFVLAGGTWELEFTEGY